MENMCNYCQRNVDPAEAIAILMEISDVSKRLACNLAKLAAVVAELHRCGETLIAVSANLRELFCSPDKQAAAEESPVTEKPIKLEDVRAVLARKSAEGHTSKVQALLRKYGADKLSRIDPAHYAALIAEAEVF